MRLYRILTEDVNRSATLALVAAQFEGFTVFETAGWWRNAPERSLVIEIMSKSGQRTAQRVDEVARAIKLQNEQDAVLVQVIELSASRMI